MQLKDSDLSLLKPKGDHISAVLGESPFAQAVLNSFASGQSMEINVDSILQPVLRVQTPFESKVKETEKDAKNDASQSSSLSKIEPSGKPEASADHKNVAKTSEVKNENKSEKVPAADGNKTEVCYQSSILLDNISSQLTFVTYSLIILLMLIENSEKGSWMQNLTMICLTMTAIGSRKVQSRRHHPHPPLPWINLLRILEFFQGDAHQKLNLSQRGLRGSRTKK
jgi:hypothetical protein